MAGIDVVSKTSSSVTLRLSGLDTSWNGATRTVYWYLADGGYPTEDAYDFKGTTSISGSPSSGGSITFSGLEANTKYYIACMIYHGSNLLAEKYGEVKTDYASSGGDGGDGGDTPTEWTSPRYNLSYPDGTQVFTIYVGLMECYCIRLLFANTGKFTISSNTAPTGNKFSVYFGTTSGFDSTTGKPRDYDAWLSNNYSFEKTLTYNDTSQYMYVWIAPSRATDIIGNLTITVEPPEATTPTYFQWSSAVAQGLPVKNVSHTEWDNFIDKIIEVLTAKKIINQPITSEQYGYPIGTTFRTMLQDCYLAYDADFGGYPLTAQKFNVARFLIGSNLPAGGTTGINDKTSRTSKVLAADLITLANCLRTIQG